MITRYIKAVAATVAVLLLLAACGSSENSPVAADAADLDVAAPTAVIAAPSNTPTAAPTTTSVVEATEAPAVEPTVSPAPAAAETTEAAATTSTFTAEVWADNWFALYIDGVLVGEDSVPITTERSFNKETIVFDATYPFTIAIEAKDFKETDSGIEYIGAQNQQMGDGGLIAQFTDNATGAVVAVTTADWQLFVTHAAPLNKECEKDADPDATCVFEITAEPDGWTTAAFDDSNWSAATEWSEAAVSPKDGYNEVSWDPSSRLVWGNDLETDNTILLRTTVQ